MSNYQLSPVSKIVDVRLIRSSVASLPRVTLCVDLSHQKEGWSFARQFFVEELPEGNHVRVVVVE